MQLWIAHDGTKFSSEEEWRTYEQEIEWKPAVKGKWHDEKDIPPIEEDVLEDIVEEVPVDSKKKISVMTREELDVKIEELLKYNGLSLELKNDFDKLFGKTDLTDEEVKILMLNRLLQKVLERSMPIEESDKLKQENEFYKRSMEDLLTIIEKDSELVDQMKMKLALK